MKQSKVQVTVQVQVRQVFKSFWVLSIFLGVIGSSLLASRAEASRMCDKDKKGDFKACVTFLKSTFEEKKENPKEFSKIFDEICQTNKNFKCTKVTVMGELEKTNQEYAKDSDWKGAVFFQVKIEDGKYLYIFQKK